MSRKRYITTELSLSGKMEELARRAGEYAVILWTWMIPHFDDWGRMEGEADKVFYTVTPRFATLGRSPEDAEQALQAMVELGLIQRYEVDGKLYIEANLQTFYALQTYIPKEKRQNDKSAYPPPPAKDATAQQHTVAQNSTEQHTVAQNSTEQHEVAQNTPSPSPSLSPSPETEIDIITPDTYVSGDAFASDEHPNNAKIIAELVGEYRKIVPKEKHRQLDYGFIGRLYNEFGPDCVLGAISELGYRISGGFVPENPLVFLRALLRPRDRPMTKTDRTLANARSLLRKWGLDPP